MDLRLSLTSPSRLPLLTPRNAFYWWKSLRFSFLLPSWRFNLSLFFFIFLFCFKSLGFAAGPMNWSLHSLARIYSFETSSHKFTPHSCVDSMFGWNYHKFMRGILWVVGTGLPVRMFNVGEKLNIFYK